MQFALAPTALALALAAALTGPTGGPTGDPADGAVPEADLAQHGDITMSGGLVTVGFTPQNHGPSDVPDTTVRLTWSVPLADVQDELPDTCLRSGPRTVHCRTGALPAATYGTPLTVRVRLAAAPAEATVQIATAWSGGFADHNRQNDQHRVLVLDTGDTYYF
ncbi:hypothetical protein AB0J38_24660 [Streptomyces sp. NPDC050095]|uniref:hypothetical protein n=1 Tax=unclassified Streptomyces TaxID=2593676 RepID=UPI003416B78F